MPWTTPETFTAGQTLTAASMNAISGNLLSIGGAWTAYTPTWTNLTVGSATQASAYIAAGKLYVVRFRITLNGSTVSGNPEFTLPGGVSMATDYNRQAVGSCTFFDDSAAALWYGVILPSTTTLARVRVGLMDASGTYAAFAAVSSSAPFTWANSDQISGTFVFEAA